MVYLPADTHLGTNWVRRSATTLMEANALPLSQTTNQQAHQLTVSLKDIVFHQELNPFLNYNETVSLDVIFRVSCTCKTKKPPPVDVNMNINKNTTDLAVRCSTGSVEFS